MLTMLLWLQQQIWNLALLAGKGSVPPTQCQMHKYTCSMLSHVLGCQTQHVYGAGLYHCPRATGGLQYAVCMWGKTAHRAIRAGGCGIISHGAVSDCQINLLPLAHFGCPHGMLALVIAQALLQSSIGGLESLGLQRSHSLREACTLATAAS